MGSAVERVVAAALRGHGLNVTIQGGTYKMLDPLSGANQVGECDVVAETPEAIVFVETKKKPHRRVSSTGDALANLIDLSGSLFDAQAQLAQHERILLHHNYIQFESGKRLDHGGRNIERIAVTLARQVRCQPMQ
jgi:Holliday junction resolvase